MSDDLRNIYLEAHSVHESDPNTALFKLRWCAETIAEKLGTQKSIEWTHGLRFELFIDELKRLNAISSDAADKLDKTRIIANRAVHEMRGTRAEAELVLGYVRELARVAFPNINLSITRVRNNQSKIEASSSLRSRIETMHVGGGIGRRRYRPRSLGFFESLKGGCLAVLLGIITLAAFSFWMFHSLTPAESKTRFDNAFALGTQKYNSRDFEEAAAAYKNATELIPTNAPAHRWMGESLLKTGDFESANGQFFDAIKLGMRDSDTWDGYAFSFLKLGMFDDAITAYQEILRYDVNYCNAYPSLADAEYRKGLYADAVKHASDPRVCEKSKGSALSTRARAFAALNQWEQAATDLNNLVQANPSDADLRDRLAEAYEGMGNTGAARSQRASAASIRWQRVRGVGSFLTWLFD